MIEESRFGPRMRTVLAAANNEAVELHHAYIGTEHLLLGLLDEGEGVAITVLENLGVDLADLRAKARAVVMRGRPEATVDTKRRFTSRAVRTLELAEAQARAFGHTYVATEHLLLGIIEEAGSVAWHALRAAGVRAEAARAEVARVLGMPSPRAD
jgi:ATP-dependent Clp protease ATP-binding subunit ClpC